MARKESEEESAIAKQISSAATETPEDRQRRTERTKLGPPVFEQLSAAKTKPRTIPFFMVVGEGPHRIQVECFIEVKRLNDSEKNEWMFAGVESWIQNDPKYGRQYKVERDTGLQSTRLFELSIINYEIATEDLMPDGRPVMDGERPKMIRFAQENEAQRIERYRDWLPDQAEYFTNQINIFNGFAAEGNEGGGEKS